MSEYEVFRFTGEKLDIEWDGRLCIHMAECGNATGELFVAGRKPWCKPDLVSREAAIEVVKRCPTGALTYTDHVAGSVETPDDKNVVCVTYNGPLFVRGDLNIDGLPTDMPGPRLRAALCRCGNSANKPFCDNSHAKHGFTDYGAVGESGSGNKQTGGSLRITPADDGPLVFAGNFSIAAASGRRAWTGSQAALCRCGRSRNKPFCDGSHKSAGFRSSG